MQKVLQVCAYGADYPGNFIASLLELEKKLRVHEVDTIYAFCEKAKEKPWCIEIQKRTKVYFLPEAKARILPKTYRIFSKIYSENNINIVHTHFELYDIPATIMAPKDTKIFWHLHDPLEIRHDSRKILWKIQYGFIGKRAKLIAVSDYYRNVVVSLGFPRQNTCVLLNGIDLSRINHIGMKKNKEYDFLTFGWDFYRKGDDIILKACDKLYFEGYRFKLLLNGNDFTWHALNEFSEGKKRSYLLTVNPTKNVNVLFEKSMIFIQASRKETFSYAVCEAAYSGLPIISSEIVGLEWAKNLPTVDFFESGDVEGLYNLLKEYLDGKVLKESDFIKTKQIIEEEYSIKAWSEKIFDIYDILGNCETLDARSQS